MSIRKIPREAVEEVNGYDNLNKFMDAVQEAADKYLPEVAEGDKDAHAQLSRPYGGFALGAFIARAADDGGVDGTYVAACHGREGEVSRAVYAILEDTPQLLNGLMETCLDRMDEEYDKDPEA